MSTENPLPKGFVYLRNNFLENKYTILETFIKTRGVFNKLVEFPPVAFTKKFEKGSNIIGDKVFKFNDKKGRSLILTPDSQVHIFTNHLVNEPKGICRYAWISPTFRYRHAPTRHFYQIGYSSINYENKNEIDELILCTQQLKTLIRSVCTDKITLKVVYPNFIKSIIKSRIENDSLTQVIFNEIKKNGMTFFDKVSTDMPLKLTLADIFSKINVLSSTSLILELNEYNKLKAFIEEVSRDTDFIVELNLDNIYSSEILCGVGFIIEVSGKKFGDGGIYSNYANRFDLRIKSAISLCTGVNPLSRKMTSTL